MKLQTEINGKLKRSAWITDVNGRFWSILLSISSIQSLKIISIRITSFLLIYLFRFSSIGLFYLFIYFLSLSFMNQH